MVLSVTSCMTWGKPLTSLGHWFFSATQGLVSKAGSGWKGLCDQQNTCMRIMCPLNKGRKIHNARAVSKAQLKVYVQSAFIRHIYVWFSTKSVYKWYSTYTLHSLIRWALLSYFQVSLEGVKECAQAHAGTEILTLTHICLLQSH